jgi:hypothetical protein
MINCFQVLLSTSTCGATTRNLDWQVINTSGDPNPDDPEPSVLFKLTDSPYTREMWDVPFEVGSD